MISALLLATAAGLADPKAVEAALNAADRARGFMEHGLAYELDLKCDEADGSVIERRYSVRSQGPHAVARVVRPTDRIGEFMVVDGRYVWQFLKTSKQPVAVTLSDRLTSGLAAVGDIIATSMADLYVAETVAADKLDGTEVTRYDLKAKDATATYERATIWLGRKDGLARKVAFRGPGGNTLRSATYAYERLASGAARNVASLVSAIKIAAEDGSRAGCAVTYRDPNFVTTNPAEFDVDKLAAGHNP